ncbi:PHP domain-containing protein [bacterium]|nr:PHP domain-containing protein [bacterium]
MKYCDLHIHSNASDGTFTPEEIVERAWNYGLSGIAISDHDTVAAIDKTRSLCLKKGIEFIPAIEISSSALDGRMHILGYYIDNKNQALLDLTNRMADSRYHRIETMCQKLNEGGIRCDFNEVLRIAAGASIGRPHLAEHMVNKGIVKNVYEAFRYYLAEGGKAYLPKLSPSPEEAINIIHNAGGLAIAAHPGVTGGMIKKLPELVSMGINGFEAYYPGHNHQITSTILNLARSNDLVVSGGSDCHGYRRGTPLMGIFKVNYRVFSLLKDRYLKQRA